jgi:hydroxymethylbilane synthase
MNEAIRIGTRDSELALWQANFVGAQLKNFGYPCTLVSVKSDGDKDLQTPLYEMGVQGIFTRALDIALLNHQIDIAVHSYKDVPTQLPKGLIVAAVLERHNPKDLLVWHPELRLSTSQVSSLSDGGNMAAFEQMAFVIATSSIRRKAQWLAKFPKSTIENIRGNVNTRLQKLNDSNWFGAIFAAAGLERINLRPKNAVELAWMLPAPAQGAVVVVCREDDITVMDSCSFLNHTETAICTAIEREFLRALLGGCSTPISALARIENGLIYFEGNITLPDGSKTVSINRTATVETAENKGLTWAHDILNEGGKSIIEKLSDAAS